MEILRETQHHEIICHTVRCQAGSHSFHHHDNFELCRVLGGKASFRIDGELISAAPGDIIAVMGQAVHQFIIEEDGTEITILQFPMRLLLGFGTSAPELTPHIKREKLAELLILEKCEALFSMLEAEEAACRAEDNPFAEALSSSLYLLLARHFSRSVESEASDTRDRLLFFKISDYINAHAYEDISIASLSEALYFSRARLSSVFRRYAGIGINDYANLIKIKKVNELLLGGSGITEAAMKCGFTSIRTFNNVYKKYMHKTPSEHLSGGSATMIDSD